MECVVKKSNKDFFNYTTMPSSLLNELSMTSTRVGITAPISSRRTDAIAAKRPKTDFLKSGSCVLFIKFNPS